MQEEGLADGGAPPPDFRLQVQTARIERRWSIADLGSRVQCDVETLAAFERGDEVLDHAVVSRVRRILQLCK